MEMDIYLNRHHGFFLKIKYNKNEASPPKEMTSWQDRLLVMEFAVAEKVKETFCKCC